MAYPNYQQNPWSGFLEDNPQSLYSAMVPSSNSMNWMDYWRSKYSDIYGDYWKGLGKQALGGNAPSMSFYDYLKNTNFENMWGMLSPQQKGSGFAPSARWSASSTLC